MDELRSTFGPQIVVHNHFVPVFGDTRTKLARGWSERGGAAGYAAHVRDICSRFGLDRVHPKTWIEVAPSSSLSCHLYLRAIAAAEADGELPPGSMDVMTRSLRAAFFEHGCDIASRGEQRRIARECGLELVPIDQRIETGEAYAGFARDLELVREHEVGLSPTLIFNEGRQRLNGNVGYRVIEANVRELLTGPIAGASWC